VEEADNPLEAMDKIRQADNSGQPYHVVLLDYRMPTINGLQLTGMIKKDRSLRNKPQVFLISAYHRDEISSTDPNAILVDEFLSKPVSESRLFEAISQAVNREQRLQEISPLISGPEDSYALLRHKRVLIVEDNLVNQQVICGILKKKQVVTQVANNGVEAVDAVGKAAQPFDAILMDLEMPEMDGIEATQKIREQWPVDVLPIVAVTAQAMRGDRERCLDAGMNGYLSKPVNPELLYTTLMDMLRKKKVQHESSGK
jgi:two-component system, sensor histidine kinase and response regulator